MSISYYTQCSKSDSSRSSISDPDLRRLNGLAPKKKTTQKARPTRVELVKKPAPTHNRKEVNKSFIHSDRKNECPVGIAPHPSSKSEEAAKSDLIKDWLEPQNTKSTIASADLIALPSLSEVLKTARGELQNAPAEFTYKSCASDHVNLISKKSTSNFEIIPFDRCIDDNQSTMQERDATIKDVVVPPYVAPVVANKMVKEEVGPLLKIIHDLLLNIPIAKWIAAIKCELDLTGSLPCFFMPAIIPTQPCYLILHDEKGYMGEDDFMRWKTVANEVLSTDEANFYMHENYAPYLCANSRNGWHWKVVRRIETFLLVKMVLGARHEYPIEEGKSLVEQLVPWWCPASLLSLLPENLLTRLPGKETYQCNTTDLLELNKYMLGRSRTSWSLQGIAHKIRDVIVVRFVRTAQKDPEAINWLMNNLIPGAWLVSGKQAGQMTRLMSTTAVGTEALNAALKVPKPEDLNLISWTRVIKCIWILVVLSIIMALIIGHFGFGTIAIFFIQLLVPRQTTEREWAQVTAAQILSELKNNSSIYLDGEAPSLIQDCLFTLGIMAFSAFMLVANTAAVFAYLAYSKPPHKDKLWPDFKHNMYYSNWTHRDMFKFINAESIEYTEAYVNRIREPYLLKNYTLDPLLKYKCTLIPIEHVSSRVYMWLVTNQPAYVPDNKDAMLLAALQGRILKPAPMDPELQRIAWQDMDLDVFFPEQAPLQHEFQAWLNHYLEMGDKKRYTLYAHEYTTLEQNCGIITPAVPIMVKADEVLLKAGELKPRLIANVPPRIQVKAAPYVRQLSSYLHTIWNTEHIYQYPDATESFVPVYGIGYTASQLDDWMDFAINHPEYHHIIVAGDDSVVYSRNVWYCADASAYDQSQSFGPLTFERKMLVRMGMPSEIANLLNEVAAWPYVYSSPAGEVTIGRKKRPMRDTGGPDTSLGNSINMAAAWIKAIASGDIATTFKNLGFDMKLQTPSIDHVNFLKGSWPLMQSDGSTRRCWMPFPSRLLKMGVIKGDPVVIYSKSLEAAVQAHIKGLLGCLRTVQMLPLVRVLFEKFEPKDNEKVTLQWMTKLTERAVKEDPGHPLLDYYAEYYKVHPSEILELEDMMRDVTYPAFISHPLWVRMAEVDYA